MTRLWDRQPTESVKAYEAFAVYRDLGVNRSLDLVSQNLSKNVQQIKRWSAQFGWVERVGVYDDYVDSQASVKAERDAIKRKADMLKRHALTGKIMQQKAVEYLDKHGVDRGSDAINAITKGIEIERKSEGLPQYLLEIMTTDDDELAREYNRLLAEVGGIAGGDGASGDADTGTAESDSETPSA